MQPEPEHLFSPVEFTVPAALGETDNALLLDSKPKMVFARDGLHARVVCLHSLDKAHYAFRYAGCHSRARVACRPPEK